LKRFAKIVIVVTLIVVVTAGLFVYINITKSMQETVTIGHVPVESFALLYVAQNQNFFEENGLKVT
jgi:ABC-type nitrate/sulfonate/bicarbonate transport system substrate-binding protein